MSITDRCATCPARQVDDNHVARCAWEAHQRHRVTDAASKYGIAEHEAVDVWAHLLSLRGDQEIAADQVVTVMDLGWRPVVGRDNA